MPDVAPWGGDHGSAGFSEGRRRSRIFLAGIFCLIVVTFVVGWVTSRAFVSPTQRAAQAAAPTPSVITAAVKRGVLSTEVVFRADVKDARPIAVPAPTGLEPALPVVTSLAVRPGSSVRNGQLLLQVATRPVFALTGTIPPFREMGPGTRGVDVAQLQDALRRTGAAIGDRPGVFGGDTQVAVRRLYSRAKVALKLSPPDADAQLSALRHQVSSARAALHDAEQHLEDDQGAGADPATLSQDRAAVRGASDGVDAGERALSAGRNSMGAVVPLGEVVFVPNLPASAVTVAVHLGSTAPVSGPLLQIGSGQAILTGSVDPAVRGQLRVGMTAVARSDLTEETVPVRVTGVSTQPAATGAGAGGLPVTLVPTGDVAPDWLGQNVGVSLTTRSSESEVLIVPAAAISTDAAGRTSVTVAEADGHQRDVTVTLGLSSGGEQAVSSTRLQVGDHVVIGQASVGAS